MNDPCGLTKAWPGQVTSRRYRYVIESSTPFDQYVSWYSWAWIHLVREVAVCHTAAAAAMQALASGGDLDAVAAAALKAAGDIGAVRETRARYGPHHRYVERYIWAQSNMGPDDLCCHDVARAARDAIASRRNVRRRTDAADLAAIVEDLMRARAGACRCERARTCRTPRQQVPAEGDSRALEAG